MDREKLQRGLGLFLDAMRPYVISVIERDCREGLSWDEDFERRMDNFHFIMQNGTCITANPILFNSIFTIVR